jgi:hypothetical protein
MINSIIVENLGGKEISDLEYNLKQLNEVQNQIREHRNGLGEVFQFSAPK